MNSPPRVRVRVRLRATERVGVRVGVVQLNRDKARYNKIYTEARHSPALNPNPKPNH